MIRIVMVNLDSPTFKFSEKIGLVIGTMMRQVLICNEIALLDSKLKNKDNSERFKVSSIANNRVFIITIKLLENIFYQ